MGEAGGRHVMTSGFAGASFSASLAGARLLSLAATAAIHVLAFAGILAATGVTIETGGSRAPHLTVVSLPPRASPPRPTVRLQPEPGPKLEPELTPMRRDKAPVSPASPAARSAPSADAGPEAETTLVPARLEPPAEVRQAIAPPVSATDLAGDAMEQYKLRIWQRINAHRPRGVRASGTTIIRLSIAPDGRLLASQVAASSSNPNLDRIALRTVRLAAPFPAAPAALGPGQIAFAVPLDFR